MAMILGWFVGGCVAAGNHGASLQRQKLVALDASLAGEPRGLCPGFRAQLVVTAVLGDGRTLSTDGVGDARLGWANLDVELQGGAVTPDGRVQMVGDPRLTAKRPARLGVRSVFHTSREALLEIPARYDCSFVLRFDGTRGAYGKPGLDAPDVEVTLSPVEVLNHRQVVRVVARQRLTDRLGLVYLDVGARGQVQISARGGASGGGGSKGGAGAKVELVVDPRVEGADVAITVDNRGSDGGADGPPVVRRVDEVLEAI
jgi:hypothetical protein